MIGRARRDRKWRGERREFVYLDEVSVTSLVAARDGAIAETVTDTLSRSAESEGRTSVSLPVKAIKLGSERRDRLTEASSREVVRRAVVQSTFRSLRTGGKHHDLPIVRDSRYSRMRLLGKITDLDSLSRKKRKRLIKAGLLTPLGDLRRGAVVEVEVRLRPHKLFSVVSAFNSIADLMKGREQVFGDAANQIAEVVPIAEVIDRVMVGLVPIHGKAANVNLATIDGERYLVDSRVFKKESPARSELQPIELVALTESGSYWRDLRRVFYTPSVFTVYARVVTPELQEKWNPVKLAALMSDVSPSLAEPFIELPAIVEGAFAENDPHETVHDGGLFLRFAEALSAHTGTFVAEHDLNESVASACQAYVAADGDVELQRNAFDIITKRFEFLAGNIRIDRNTVHRARTSALASSSSGASPAAPGSSGSEEIKQLEVEIVAIYW